MMAAGAKAASAWHILLLLSILWAVAAAKDQPSLKAKEFDNQPRFLRYFEDSDVVIFKDDKENILYRSKDAGASWDKVGDIPNGVAWALVMHPYDANTAFVLTTSNTHYKTNNQGEKWDKFKTHALPSKFQPEILVFHADDPSRIIFNGMDCQGIFCDEEALYTTDGFKDEKNTKILRTMTSGCWWAKSSIEFTTGDKDLDKDRTLCIVRDPFSLHKQDQRLVVSDAFFAVKDEQIQEFEPNVDTNKGVEGVVSLAVVKKFLLIATSSFNSDEMALYVTDNTLKWHRAMFPNADGHNHSHQINEAAYTILESTNYSIQIDVLASRPIEPFGVLFTSNSNGTYFTENVPYTNRNELGHVDFEKISGIQGVFLVNLVENGADVDDNLAKKKIKTRITFDDGRTFNPVQAGDEEIHLHSVTELDNSGRVFSSPAPGLVMGNGNTGKTLSAISEANLYVSDDAGVSWKKALDGPHKYEFGDSGSILVAVKDSHKADVKEISYSLNHGDKWTSVPLPDNLSIRPGLLTTTQDSTSLKFILIGDVDKKYHIISIDFDGLHERDCGDDDMEDWHARVDKDGNVSCIMGRKQTYRRRKKDADCFVRNEFKDPVPKTEDCECTDADFECDYNFQRSPDDNNKCIKVGQIEVPDDQCKDNPEGKFKGSSGWRLIPGNTCQRKDGKQKDDTEERDCSEGVSAPKPPGSGNITHAKTEFEVELKDFQKIYLERGDASTEDDETIIIRPAQLEGDHMMIEPKLWITHDHGKKWERILKDEKIQSILPHPNLKDVVFFTTPEKVIYTINRGKNFHSFKPPSKQTDIPPLSFHPDKKDWLIWIGEECEDIGGHKSCFAHAQISTNRGDKWDKMLRGVEKCEFTGNSAYEKLRSSQQIVCLVKDDEEKPSKTVLTSDDFFSKNKTRFHDGEVEAVATMSEFVVLTSKENGTDNLQAYGSLDGKQFAQAQFPHNFHQDHTNMYTLLDSSTHAINLFLRADGGADSEYGSILKSNSNGTSFVLSASNVNCDARPLADYEKVSGLEGVALINIVANAGKKEKKKTLQTKISHNDGSEWTYLAPPAKDADGKSYKCSSAKGDKSCALHLHHYTERDDKRKTFAAATAVGYLFGVGNVGSSLGDIKEADTFLTTDGGISWKSVKKGHWTWQYGDQGSIMVLVQRATSGNPVKTKSVSYSIDEGATWIDYEFNDSEVTVLDITTVQSGTSRNFLLWCESDKGQIFSVNIDFTGLADKPCEDDDYTLWSPKHPTQDDDCLFGHIAKYLRKKPDSKCYNNKNLQRLQEHTDCPCKEQDFECAYNYEQDNHGQCKLVPGLDPLTGQEWCDKNPDEKSWFEPTGYRRIPLSTCKGGKELDKMSTEHACDKYEKDFEKAHPSTSGVTIFFAVVIPFALAGTIGWWVYRNWDGKFGQIRLGDQASSFDSDQPWIKYPVIVVSALVAVIASLPLLVGSLWRTATGAYERIGGSRDRSWFSRGPHRFTTRESFARGRGRYSMVEDDEGELLGEESDEDN